MPRHASARSRAPRISYVLLGLCLVEVLVWANPVASAEVRRAVLPRAFISDLQALFLTHAPSLATARVLSLSLALSLHHRGLSPPLRS
jgi:hypothetical protein